MMLLFVLSKETKYNMEYIYIYGGENVFDQALINEFKTAKMVPQTEATLFYNNKTKNLIIKDGAKLNSVHLQKDNQFKFRFQGQKYSISFNQINSLFKYPTIMSNDLITVEQLRTTLNKHGNAVFNIFYYPNSKNVPHLFWRWDTYGHNKVGYYKRELKHYFKQHPEIGRKINIKRAKRIQTIAKKYNLPVYLIQNRVKRGEKLNDPNIVRPARYRGPITVCGRHFASKKALADYLGVTKSCIGLRLKRWGYNDPRVLQKKRSDK